MRGKRERDVCVVMPWNAMRDKTKRRDQRAREKNEDCNDAPVLLLNVIHFNGVLMWIVYDPIDLWFTVASFDCRVAAHVEFPSK